MFLSEQPSQYKPIEIMNLSQLPNPVIAAQVLLDSFKQMKDDEYQKTLADILRRGELFAASDDSEFSGSLSEPDAVLYAATCRPFLDAFQKLKKNSRFKSVSQIYLAQTIAWWQSVSAFRTLCGGPLPE